MIKPKSAAGQSFEGQKSTPENVREANTRIEIAGRAYLRPEQLAEQIGVSTRTLARWDEARIGPPRIKIGQLVLYDSAKFVAWLQQHETSPVALQSADPSDADRRVV